MRPAVIATAALVLTMALTAAPARGAVTPAKGTEQREATPGVVWDDERSQEGAALANGTAAKPAKDWAALANKASQEEAAGEREALMGGLIGLAVFAVWAGLIVSAVTGKKYKDVNGRIRTYSLGWWVLVLLSPWGWVWALCRSEPFARHEPEATAPELRALELRELRGENEPASARAVTPQGVGVSMPRLILVLYGLAVAAACVYVPWMVNLGAEGTRGIGYGFLWAPLDGAVDVTRVVLELVAISAMAAVAMVLVGFRKRHAQSADAEAAETRAP